MTAEGIVYSLLNNMIEVFKICRKAGYERNNGIQDVIVTMELPPSGVAGFVASGLAVGRGWGYALIKQVSYRYGGSMGPVSL